MRCSTHALYVNAVYVPSDSLLPAVLSGLDQAGRLRRIDEPEHVVVVTADADPVGCRALQQGLIDADIVAPVRKFGDLAVQAAQKAARHQRTYPARVVLPGLLLTPAHLAGQRDATGDCGP